MSVETELDDLSILRLAAALESVRGKEGFYFVTNRQWDKGGNIDAARLIIKSLRADQ